MRMDEVREKAKKFGIKTARMKKEDLIRAVQVAEGNFPCFGSAAGYCDQEACCWIDDCLGR
jgi:predicted metal-binding transcription factor (methanogenesis marker protein 9)